MECYKAVVAAVVELRLFNVAIDPPKLSKAKLKRMFGCVKTLLEVIWLVVMGRKKPSQWVKCVKLHNGHFELCE